MKAFEFNLNVLQFQWNAVVQLGDIFLQSSLKFIEWLDAYLLYMRKFFQ
jgi:hypothetical protein